MTKPLPEAERWEDPIVADVRKAREKLFAEAGCDLEEFCRRLNEQQEQAGRRAVSRVPHRPKGRRTHAVPRPNKSVEPTPKGRRGSR